MGAAVAAQAVTSKSRDVMRRETSGNDYYTQLSHSDRKWQYYTNYTDISPNFQAALGFIPRTDIRQVKSRLGYKWWREKKALVDFGPAVVVLTRSVVVANLVTTSCAASVPLLPWSFASPL